MKKQTILVLTVLTVILTTTSTWATTFYVNPGIGAIQAAMDASFDGDTIIVNPGLYYENIKFNGKNIVLTSTDPDSSTVVENTVIDGSYPLNPEFGSVVMFDGSETTTCILQGFTIQNGTGTYPNGMGGNNRSYGGGIYGGHGYPGTNAVIRKNIITNCSSHTGGGIYNVAGLIERNTITDNSATHEWDSGGGLSSCSGTICFNTISNNTSAYHGGGLDSCHGYIHDNIIVGNIASEHGGGIRLYQSEGIVERNIISNNTTIIGAGGGLFVGSGAAIIRNNIFRNNHAVGGGGVYFGGFYDNPIVCYYNTIIGNTAEGSGGGISSDGHQSLPGADIRNCVIWGNTAPSYPQIRLETSTVQNCCIQDWSGGGAIISNPLLTTDGHLQFGSPCINRSGPGGAIAGQSDIDGEVRKWDGYSDIGADEYIDADRDELADRVESNTGVYVSPENTGTDPNDTDTDHDKMPDGWEVVNSLNPFLNDAADDPDTDTKNNYSECIAGTDPWDPNSVFRICNLVFRIYGPYDQVDITWTIEDGRNYQLYYTEDATAWAAVEGSYTNYTDTAIQVDTFAPGSGKRFYKVEVWKSD